MELGSQDSGGRTDLEEAWREELRDLVLLQREGPTRNLIVDQLETQREPIALTAFNN